MKHLRRKVPEEEDIALANLFGNFNVCTVDGTDQQTTIETELHVTGTASLCSSGTNVLRNVGSRNENLSERYGVVRKEVEGEKILGVRIAVDDAGDIDDEANGQLGNVIYRPVS